MTNPPNPPRPSPDIPDPDLAAWLREHRAPGEPAFDENAAWSRFEAKHLRAGIVHGARRPLWARPVFVAATVLAAAALAFIVVRARTSSSTERGAEMLRRVAASGGREVITLDDGSRITLNGGSTLRYPAHGRDRDVYLDGEALFEITHDPGRAFRVHAGKSVLRDIGTKFTVRAYASEPSVEVAVTEGRVAFGRDSTGKQPLDLGAGDAAVLDSSGAVAELPASAVEALTGWTTGALVFDNVRLADVAREIERRYGVRVVVADSTLARRPVAARFHGEPVVQVLDAISLALGAHYDVVGSTYTLRSGRR